MKNSTPEISLKPLAEFINASASRKKAILKTIKSSSSEDMVKKIRYNEAKSAIRTFMTDDSHDLKIFEVKQEQVKNKKVTTQTQAANKTNTLIAIKNLQASAQNDFVPYLQFKSERGLPRNLTSKLMDGVLVHLTPDLILKDKITGEIVGIIKLVFTKKAITPLEGQIICGLLQKHIEKEYNTRLSLRNCFALDVFAKRGFISPEDFNYYSKLLKKAYAEINDLWDKV